jgi:hypothetical protein
MVDKLISHNEHSVVMEPNEGVLKKIINDNLTALKSVRDGVDKNLQLNGTTIIDIVTQSIIAESFLENLATLEQKPIEELERHRRRAGIYFEGCIALNYCADRDGNRWEQYRYALDSYLVRYREHMQAVVDLTTPKGESKPIVAVAPYLI